VGGGPKNPNTQVQDHREKLLNHVKKTQREKGGKECERGALRVVRPKKRDTARTKLKEYKSKRVGSKGGGGTLGAAENSK